MAKPGQTRWLMPALWGGLLYGLAFPSWPSVELGPLAWVCLLPLLRPAALALPFWRYALAALALGMLGSAVAGRWTFGYEGGRYGLLAALWHGLIVAVPLWGGRWVSGRLGWHAALWSLPLLWTAWEWLAANHQPFFWGALGATASNLTVLMQMADLAGVWGLSAWVVGINAALAWAWWGRGMTSSLDRGADRPDIECQGLQPDTKPRFGSGHDRQRLRHCALVLGLAIAPPLAYGLWSLQAGANAPTGPALRLALMQPGAQHAAGREVLLQQMEEVAPERDDLAVWPESVLDTLPFHDPGFRSQARRWEVPVLLSFVAPRSNMQRPPGFTDPYVGSLVLDQSVLERIVRGPAREMLEPHYRKQRLVPFAELQLLPDAWLGRWPALHAFAPSRMRHEPGERILLHTRDREGRTHALAPLICYEAVFPHLAAQAVRQGAEALFVQANDIHFGHTEAWQSASFARLRAVETRRPLVRVSTSGTAGVMDAQGRWQTLQSDPRIDVLRATLTLPAPQAMAHTLYVRRGDWLPRFCAQAALVVFAAGLLRRRRKPAKVSQTA